MKQRFLLVAVAVLTSMASWADDGDVFTAQTVEGVEMTFKVISEEEKTCSVGKNFYGRPAVDEKTTSAITIPMYVNGYKVTQISDGAFNSCIDIPSVEIPNSVTSIGNYAFQHTQNLVSLTIPASVKHIGRDALQTLGQYYNQREYICFLSETPPVLESMSIDQYTKVYVPVGCVDAYKTADVWSSHSQRIFEMPEPQTPFATTRVNGVDIEFQIVSEDDKTVKVSGVADRAIAGELVIPQHVRGYQVVEIGDLAFDGCAHLTKVTVPEGVRRVRALAFHGCTALESITLPKVMEMIGSRAFQGCNGLKRIDMPELIDSNYFIGSVAFWGCHQIRSIVIPLGIGGIDNEAFSYCTSLESVVLPSQVTSIHSWAFSDCPSLQQIVSLNPKPNDYNFPTFEAFSKNLGTFENCTLCVLSGTKHLYEAAETWRNFVNIVEIDGYPDVSTIDDGIYLNPVLAVCGNDVQVAICLKNAQEATAYSFDLVLPQGITVATDERGKYIDALSDRHDDHTRTFNNQGNNTYSFAALSGSSEPLSGNDGIVRLLTLRVADNVVEGSHAIEIRNAKYSTPDGVSVRMPAYTTSISVQDYMQGDVNGDSEVDIADAVSIVNHIVGKSSANFVEKAADVNGDSEVDIADAVTIVNFIVGKTANLSRKTAAQDLPEITYSVENVTVPQNGEADLVVKFHSDTDGMYSGYQFNIALPAGIEFVTNARGNAVYTTGDCYEEAPSITSNIQNGVLKVACYTANTDPILGTDGTLLTFRVRSVGVLAVGETLAGHLTDAKASTEGGLSIPVEDTSFTVTIGAGGVVTGISGTPSVQSVADGCFNLQGIQAVPTAGLYIRSGNKVIVK